MSSKMPVPDGFELRPLKDVDFEELVLVRSKPVKHKFKHDGHVWGMEPLCMESSCGKPASDPIHEVAKPLTDGMTDREKLIREGFAFDSDRDCDAARYLIGVIDVLRWPPAPPAKPRMMQANPACREGTHAVEHPEQPSCSNYPLCIPVEQTPAPAKPRIMLTPWFKRPHEWAEYCCPVGTPCTPVEQPKARRWVVEFSDNPKEEAKSGRWEVDLVREFKPITWTEADAAYDRATHKYMSSNAGMGVLLARELGIEVEE